MLIYPEATLWRLADQEKYFYQLSHWHATARGSNATTSLG
jgi:hypothetical protein